MTETKAKPSHPSGILRPTKAHLARMSALEKDKENRQVAAQKKQRSSKMNALKPPRSNRLTIPKSPRLITNARTRRTTRGPQMSATSRELLEIENIRKDFEKQKKRNERFHQATIQGFKNLKSMSSDQAQFKMAVRSCGGIGVPAVRRMKLTTPVEFQFETDKRAATKRKTRSMTRLEEEQDQQEQQVPPSRGLKRRRF